MKTVPAGTTVPPTARGPGRTTLLAVGFALILADQLTKLWAASALRDGPIEVVPGKVGLSLAGNPSNSFGLFTGSTASLTLLSVALVGLLGFMLWRAPRPAERVGLVLMLVGAVGNILDRLTQAPGFGHGLVVDFIAVPGFATFNLADVWIVLGAVVMIVAGAFHHGTNGLRRPGRASGGARSGSS